MYTFNAIILEKQILREKHIRIVVLTKEYGRITLWYRKQLTGVDIGDIARIVVRRENTMNIVKNIETKEYLIRKKWDYETLFTFLSLLNTLKICTADEDASPELYNDYENTLKIMGESISVEACLLLQMRIFKRLGSLNPDFFQEDAILRYMYAKISSTPLERILKHQNIKHEHRDIIQKSNLFSLSTFI